MTKTSFRDLHKPGDPFVLANAWDAGSARVLAGLGAQAIATSSAAQAFTLGRPDGGTLSRDEALSHAQDLVAAVSLPVSGDFENGFSNDPDEVAQTVKLAFEAGLSGISIEDTAFPDMGARDFDLAVECVKAAASAARALPGDFVLVARADGVMNGDYDLDEALNRIRAFDKAGADCLYVPCPGSVEDLKRVVQATKKPVNALPVGPLQTLTRSDFAALGVARISLGSLLARSVQERLIANAGDILGKGLFSTCTPAGSDLVDGLLDKGAAK
ncbi:isocitrate lyase/PEP mutase family protein [Celeribacter neptunius]|uniref:2-Methylisocitrate lyase, PEP mutase family n=1 Tax=Celeribacter neptunius TaxID=588602 RepID=A0A1I3KM94_9RHOB|nr:isocitrate lyase/phosphoenolpyruvate mutase family protein [Celeribacter neptunius]SFI73606.1 2-Methylisocitrate lyase, PEP mutase family [Celeribacter neptunius]